MSLPILWLAGPPGSGKSTAGKAAALTLGLKFESAGERFRAEAERRGLSLADFSRYAEAHEEVDRRLDEALQALAEPGMLIDARVVGALLRRAGRAVFAVRVDAREEVRAARLAGREGTDRATSLERMRARSESERRRYTRLYGVDPERESYDRTLDTSDLGREATAERLADLLRPALGAA